MSALNLFFLCYLFCRCFLNHADLLSHMYLIFTVCSYMMMLQHCPRFGRGLNANKNVFPAKLLMCFSNVRIQQLSLANVQHVFVFVNWIVINLADSFLDRRLNISCQRLCVWIYTLLKVVRQPINVFFYIIRTLLDCCLICYHTTSIYFYIRNEWNIYQIN